MSSMCSQEDLSVVLAECGQGRNRLLKTRFSIAQAFTPGTASVRRAMFIDPHSRPSALRQDGNIYRERRGPPPSAPRQGCNVHRSAQVHVVGRAACDVGLVTTVDWIHITPLAGCRPSVRRAGTPMRSAMFIETRSVGGAALFPHIGDVQMRAH